MNPRHTARRFLTRSAPLTEVMSYRLPASCVCIGIYARLQLAHWNPPRSRLSDRTIAAVRVLAPVTWRITFLTSRALTAAANFSPLAAVWIRGRSSAAAVQQALPPRGLIGQIRRQHRPPPIVQLSITHRQQWRWSGSAVSERSRSGDSVRDYFTSRRQKCSSGWFFNAIFFYCLNFTFYWSRHALSGAKWM